MGGAAIFWSDYALKVVEITFSLFFFFFFCASGKDNMKTLRWCPVSVEIFTALVGCFAFMGFLEISSPGCDFPSQSSTLRIAAGRVDWSPSVRGVCKGVTRRQVCEGPHCPCSCPWLRRFEEHGMRLCHFTNFAPAVHYFGGWSLCSQNLLKSTALQKNES